MRTIDDVLTLSGAGLVARTGDVPDQSGEMTWRWSAAVASEYFSFREMRKRSQPEKEFEIWRILENEISGCVTQMCHGKLAFGRRRDGPQNGLIRAHRSNGVFSVLFRNSQ